ncbi:MAG: hypothetical protein WBL61_20805 [Bryobacteraceae bacterium]
MKRRFSALDISCTPRSRVLAVARGAGFARQQQPAIAGQPDDRAFHQDIVAVEFALDIQFLVPADKSPDGGRR